MAPEVRVYYPHGQEETMRTAIATVPGTRILSTKEPKPTKVRDISSKKLAQFIRETTDIEVPKNFYGDVLASIRSLQEEEQSDMLSSYFRDNVVDFPSPQEFSGKIVELNKIPWFIPSEEPDAEEVEKKINAFRKSFGRNQTRILLIRDWKTVLQDNLAFYYGEDGADTDYNFKGNSEDLNFLIQHMTKAIGTGVRNQIEDSISQSGFNVTNRLRYHHARRIVMRLERLMRNELRFAIANPSQKDPYQPLFDIYRMGGWPIGQTENEYLVFFPQQTQRHLL